MQGAPPTFRVEPRAQSKLPSLRQQGQGGGGQAGAPGAGREARGAPRRQGPTASARTRAPPGTRAPAAAWRKSRDGEARPACPLSSPQEDPTTPERSCREKCLLSPLQGGKPSKGKLKIKKKKKKIAESKRRFGTRRRRRGGAVGAGASRVCVGANARECECVCARVCVRGAVRSTHHLAGGARPLRGRIGNVEASLASSATCWLKHQLGQNKKLLKKNLLKITEIERRRRRRLPPPAGPPAPSPAPRPRAQRACVLL